MIFFHFAGFGGRNAEVFKDRDDPRNPHFRLRVVQERRVPGAAALLSRRSPASRLIGTFAALCQFSNE
jgi:hypothetical protein